MILRLRTLTATAAVLTLAGVGLAQPVLAADLPLVDDFEAPLAQGAAGSVPIGYYQAQSPNSTLSYQQAIPDPQVPDHAAGNQVLSLTGDIDAWGVVVHAFEDSTVTNWVTQDWSTYAGMQFWFRGEGQGTSMFVDVIDNRPAGSTTDNAERWSIAFTDDTAGWRLVQLPFDAFARKEIGNGAPNDGFQLNAVHGWAIGSLATGGAKTFALDDVSTYGVAPPRALTVGFDGVDTSAVEGNAATVRVRLSTTSESAVTARVRSTTGTARPGVDYTPIDTIVSIPAGSREATVTVPTIDNGSFQGERGVVLELSDVSGAELGRPPLTRVLVTDDESRPAVEVADFEGSSLAWSPAAGTTASEIVVAQDEALAQAGQSGPEGVLELTKGRGRSRTAGVRFPSIQDWSTNAGLSLSYYGQNTGRDVSVQLGQATADPTAGNSRRWRLVWADEFNAKRGSAPDSTKWTNEIGDGTIIGKPGWGNDELQYYTAGSANAAHDGRGNLVVTTKENTDPDLMCYYGPCKYTSARLVGQYKAEFEYGRIEARLRVPTGDGIWPAFWALGSDISVNPWPASGEIDIMENVGRDPNVLFGTIHGPGYSGGQSYGGTHDFGTSMSDAFHTVGVTWSPEHIVWTIDGQEFHEAIPANVAPNDWVFEHPFFLLINTAVGGNFGGPVSEAFPQTYALDYVRVYQGDRAERTYTATFTDNQVGWQQVTIPFDSFTPDRRRGPALDLTRISSLSIDAPAKGSKVVAVDDIRLTCAATTTATSTADAGPGSLRNALGAVCDGGQVSVSSELAGQTIALSSPLSTSGTVSVDGNGVILDGQGQSRILEVTQGADVSVSEATMTHGYGSEIGGAIINNGTLRLTDVTVADNLVTTTGNEFWKGGGGIYTGENAVLELTRSSVADNAVDNGPGGGLYGFFGSSITVSQSTISGNTSSDVAGGIRSLGSLNVSNSTISGNTATGWHGGGIFATDGTVTLSYSTVAGNTSPADTAGGLFVGTFGESSATLELDSSIVDGNSGAQCLAGHYGAGAVALTSLGHNVFGDTSCGQTATDVVGSALLGALADNGGPTLTLLPAAGSPAVSHGNPGTAAALDQRGIARDASPDAGSVERTS